MPEIPRRFRLAAFLRGDAAAVAALVTVFLGANRRLLVGTAVEHWDAEDFFAPFFSFLARMSRSGHLLLWNPFSEAGAPDFAEPQVGAFSPVTLLYGLVAGPDAFCCYWLSLWLLGGLGMYVLARALAAPPWGALIASLGLIFSGFYVGHSEHTSVVYSFAFLPWIVWRVRAALITDRSWPAVEAGALWGLSALAGNPAIVIPGALFVGAVSLAWLPGATPGFPPLARGRRWVVTMALLAVIGIVVLAPSYLSFRHEVAGFSDRSLPVSREAALPAQALGFNWLLNAASPMIVIGTFQSPGWPELDICYLPLYFGAALPVLALLALWSRRTRWEVWGIAVAGLLFLGLTLGSTLPLRGWLYDLLPPTRFIRHPPMFRGCWTLAVAMLAAVGTGWLDCSHGAPSPRLDQPTRTRRRSAVATADTWTALAVIAAVLAVSSVAAFVWVLCTLPTVRGEPLLPLASVHLALAWLGLALLCVAAARRETTRRWFAAALTLLTALDLLGAYALLGGVVYNDAPPPPPTAPTLPLLDLGAPGFARTANGHGNRNLYALRPAFGSYTAMTNPVRTLWEKDPLLIRGVVGPRRLWFAETAPSVPSSTEAFLAFQRRVHEVNALVVLRHTRADLLGGAPGAPSNADLAAIAAAPAALPLVPGVERYQANDLALRVTCPRAGFLLLTDRWSRSWTATVNGQPAPVEGGDFLFRLVPVVAGENLLVMRFEPPAWLFPLLTLSWVTLAVVGLGSLWRGRPQRGKISLRAIPGIRPASLAEVACVAS